MVPWTQLQILPENIAKWVPTELQNHLLIHDEWDDRIRLPRRKAGGFEEHVNLLLSKLRCRILGGIHRHTAVSIENVQSEEVHRYLVRTFKRPIGILMIVPNLVKQPPEV